MRGYKLTSRDGKKWIAVQELWEGGKVRYYDPADTAMVEMLLKTTRYELTLGMEDDAPAAKGKGK